MFDLIGLDHSQLILNLNPSDIRGFSYSQNQLNIFVNNLIRSIDALQQTNVLTATYDDLVNSNVRGPQHYSTAPALMERLLASASDPASPSNMQSIALTRQLPAGNFIASPILAQIIR